MLKSAIALCLLAQVCAADPEIEASVCAARTSEYDAADGFGPQVVMGAGLAISPYAVLGLQGSWTSYDAGDRNIRTVGARVTATRHFGITTVQLGVGVNLMHTNYGADDPGVSDLVLAARLAVSFEVWDLGAGGIEMIGGIERSPLLGFPLADWDQVTTLFLGVGFRMKGTK